MKRVYDLLVIIIVGVILAEFVKGFYTPTGTPAAFGGGSGVLISGVASLWATGVDAMLGNPAGPGPNSPGSQATPKPGTIPPPKPKPTKPCFTLFGICVPFTGG